MTKHWLAYHMSHSKLFPYPYSYLGKSTVYSKKEMTLDENDIVWVIQGNKTTSAKFIDFTLVDCFIVGERTTPHEKLPKDFIDAFDAKKSLLTKNIPMNNADSDWSLLYKTYLTKRPMLRLAKTNQIMALQKISGISF